MMGKAPILGLDLESLRGNGDLILLLSVAAVANVAILIGGRSRCYKTKDGDTLSQGVRNGVASGPQQQKREAPRSQLHFLDEVQLSPNPGCLLVCEQSVAQQNHKIQY